MSGWRFIAAWMVSFKFNNGWKAGRSEVQIVGWFPNSARGFIRLERPFISFRERFSISFPFDPRKKIPVVSTDVFAGP
jgi:hypothetical protein